MNAVEDRVRDVFARVVVPDVPVPAISSLQRRARRHRLNQATGALGAMATVGMCIVGGMSFTGHGAAGGELRVRTHLAGAGTNQWLVSKQTIAGHQYQTASFLESGRPCTVSTLSGRTEALGVESGTSLPPAGGWCQPDNWPVGEVADQGSYSVTSGGRDVVDIEGRVPLNARTVVVHVDDAATTVQAVVTPTSSTERFFSAYLVVPSARRVPITPVVGVFDRSGHPVAAPLPHNDVLSGIGAQSTHFSGLPSNQTLLSTTSSGLQAVVYRDGDAPCVALALHGVLRAHTCASSTPLAGRPLIAINVPKFGRMILGDAPTWANQLRINGPDSSDQVTVSKVNGISDRTFWLAQGPLASHDSVIATCAIGDNCTVVQRWTAPSVS